MPAPAFCEKAKAPQARRGSKRNATAKAVAFRFGSSKRCICQCLQVSAQNRTEAQRSGASTGHLISGRPTYPPQKSRTHLHSGFLKPDFDLDIYGSEDPAFWPAAPLRHTSVFAEVENLGAGRIYFARAVEGDGWSRPPGGGTQTKRHAFQRVFLFGGAEESLYKQEPGEPQGFVWLSFV